MPRASLPRISILLMAYNQAEVVEDALRSCLFQRCDPVEIIASDDASTDETYAILSRVAAEYDGPHQLTVRRNEVNLGIAAHYNLLVGQTTSDLLVTAAGDDISEPERVALLTTAWEQSSRRADLISSYVTGMSRDGTVQGIIETDDLAHYRGVDDWIQRRPYVIGAGHAFTRRMMRRFGPFHSAIPYEDQIMTFRAIASGGAVTVRAPLVRYRQGGHSAGKRFQNPAEQTAWRRRRLDQEISERTQLIEDAGIAGCGPEIAEVLASLGSRQLYMQQLYAADSAAERWNALRTAKHVPAVWRIRKWLQACYPGLHI